MSHVRADLFNPYMRPTEQLDSVLTCSIFKIIFCICSIHQGTSYSLLPCSMMAWDCVCANVYTQSGWGAISADGEEAAGYEAITSW